MANWRAPGCDNLHLFWWKHFTAVHGPLSTAFQEILDGVNFPPVWFSCGVTSLLFKKGDPTLPSNYRPITCLPTVYKIFTAVLGESMWQHLRETNLLAAEQTGCTPGRGGCCDQLLIDQMVLEDARSRHRNLVVAWIDFRKAFDSISHEWLLTMLELYRFSAATVECIRSLLPSWRTRLMLPDGTLNRSLTIKRGIFQGDSLSPLLFCLALNPISMELQQAGAGYGCGPPGARRPVSHLWYMDDLKLFAPNQQQLSSMSTLVASIAGDFGLHLNPASRRGCLSTVVPHLTPCLTSTC